MEASTTADNLPVLCWTAAADGWIYWYNQQWYDYTSTVPADMAGWGWRSVHHPKTLDAVLARWTACIATHKPFQMIFPLRGHDGAYRPFLTLVHPVMSGDDVAGWCGVNVEITALLDGPYLAEWLGLQAAMAA